LGKRGRATLPILNRYMHIIVAYSNWCCRSLHFLYMQITETKEKEKGFSAKKKKGLPLLEHESQPIDNCFFNKNESFIY
jgi:hypothetical protein